MWRREKSHPYRESNSDTSALQVHTIKLQLRTEIPRAMVQRHGLKNGISKAGSCLNCVPFLGNSHTTVKAGEGKGGGSEEIKKRIRCKRK
jgi:hypothetical protein